MMTTPTFLGYFPERGFCQPPYWTQDVKGTALNPDLKLLSSPSSSSSCSYSTQSCPRQVTPSEYSKRVLGSPYLNFTREPDHLESGEKIKRPMNAFMVWSQERRAQIANSESKMHNSQISKELGAEWRMMKPEEKAPYIRKAKELRDELMQKHPDYVYRPKRKPRLAPPKSVNRSVSPASSSCMKPTERVVDNPIPQAAAQLLLASEAQKQQSLMIAYQTQLLAALFKETQQKTDLLMATKQVAAVPVTTCSSADLGFMPYVNNPLQRQILGADPSLISTLATLSPHLNPLLLAKLSQTQLPPTLYANVSSQ